jgi:excisionase family DNA binding protein
MPRGIIEEMIVQTVNEAIALNFDGIKEHIEKQTSFPDWMNIREVCRYVQLSETKVRELMKKGLRYSDRGGDKRFYKQDVDNWMRGGL